jgi:hypothetical protein
MVPDVVFSRAHFSMALAVAIQAWHKNIDPDKAWLVDPTNYVTKNHWNKIILTEMIGQTIARYDWLKTLKSFIDRFGRQKLPILDSITAPLLFLTERLHKPIISMHIASGNILIEQGKKVVQVITDPHVRDEYLTNAEKPNVLFCVFDERTKIEFLEKAMVRGLKPNPNHVIVTGPPIDPRVVAIRKHKIAWRNGPLRLCITTGGLGTNKTEIKTLLEQLLPELRKRPSPYQLLIYAGTHEDIYQMVVELAKKHHVAINRTGQSNHDLRVIHHPHLVDANEHLLHYGFPWAHGFITKPSGDMAYDAAAAGCFLLTLSEWGEWELNIRELFEQKNIGRRAEGHHIVEQLQALTTTHGRAQSWVEKAMNEALSLEPLMLHGAREILQVAENFSKLTSTS